MIQNCTNYGKVTSNHGHASGIAAENDGMIKDCTVKSSKSTETQKSTAVAAMKLARLLH